MTAKRTEKLGKTPASRQLQRPLRRPPAIVASRSERSFALPAVARFVPAKSVGSFVPTLTRKAFEKFGFSTATLIMDWAGIVGADCAAYTAPERLKWPRGPAGDQAEEEGRPGATLILRVDPARALDVEYRARQIKERINAYFGYRAVDTIRLVQAPLSRDDGNHARRRPGVPQPQKAAGNADGDPLVAALARLEQGVLRHQTTGR